MKRKPRQRELPPCGELGPDDGIDPKILFRREESRRNDQRKDRQLCKQVYRVITLALADLSRQTWARDLVVEEVTPAPDRSRLRVTISFLEPRDFESAMRAVLRLRRVSGDIRIQVAAAITRKRVPELMFELAPGEGCDE